jgi:hypothetical protein
MRQNEDLKEGEGRKRRKRRKRRKKRMGGS